MLLRTKQIGRLCLNVKFTSNPEMLTLNDRNSLLFVGGILKHKTCDNHMFSHMIPRNHIRWYSSSTTAQTEISYAEDLFRNSMYYRKSIAMPIEAIAPTSISKEEAERALNNNYSNADEIINALKILCYHVIHDDTIPAENYAPIVDTLLQLCNDLTENQIITVLKYLVPLASKLNSLNSYRQLHTRLDVNCQKYFLKTSIDQRLYVCDLIYKTRRTCYSSFIGIAIYKLCMKCKKLSPKNVVQILFLLSIVRKPSISMYDLEYRLEECIDMLSINEIGIALLGFFKTNAHIKSVSLMSTIIATATKNIKVINTVSLAAIMKSIRHNARLDQTSQFQTLLRTLVPELSRFSLLTLTHIAQACASLNIYEKDVLDYIMERFQTELKSARLKDIERIISTIYTLNISIKQTLLDDVIEEITLRVNSKENTEVSFHLELLPRILGCLTCLGEYPINLIELILQPTNVERACRRQFNKLERNFFILQCNLQVEVHNYNGPFLQPGVLQTLKKVYVTDVVKNEKTNSKYHMLISELLYICQDIAKLPTTVCIDSILPQYSLDDIIICLDKDNNFIPIQTILSATPKGDIKHIPKEYSHHKWIVLIASPVNHVIKGSDKPNGMNAGKIRQLKQLGYIPIMIKQTEWNLLTRSQKIQFLNNIFHQHSTQSQNVCATIM